TSLSLLPLLPLNYALPIAKDFSSSSYGGGLHTSFSIPHLGKVIAGSAGIELVSFLSETHEFPDAQTGLRVQQETNQDYFRFYLGDRKSTRLTPFTRSSRML